MTKEKLIDWILKNCIFEYIDRAGIKYRKYKKIKDSSIMDLIHKHSEYLDECFLKSTISLKVRIEYILGNGVVYHRKLKRKYKTLLEFINGELLNTTGNINTSLLIYENKAMIKSWPYFYEEIMSKTSFLNPAACMAQRVWHIYKGTYTAERCKHCNKNLVAFRNFKVGYSSYCSSTCWFNSDEYINKNKSTKLRKYGDENYNNREKSKTTCLVRHGVEYPAQSKEIFLKVKKTKFEKYGDENYTNLKKAQETCFAKRGVIHHIHDGNIADKCKGGYKKSWHDYVLPSGKIIKIQGYEPIIFDELLIQYNEEDILYKKSDMPKIWYKTEDEKTHRYYPDFFIPKDNILIEVKSSYTFKVDYDILVLKAKAAIKLGFNFEIKIPK